jgi:hypothetical protein
MEYRIYFIALHLSPCQVVDERAHVRHTQDGNAFCALINKHRPDLLDYDALEGADARTKYVMARLLAVGFKRPRPVLVGR